VYHQTGLVSNSFKTCGEAGINKGCSYSEGDNFIDFSGIQILPYYKFRLVYSDGADERSLSWTQDENPFTLSDSGSNPQRILTKISKYRPVHSVIIYIKNYPTEH
jgi:hypothetical protein